MLLDYQKVIRVLGFDLDQTLFPKSPEIDTAIQEYLYQKISQVRGVSFEEARTLFQDLYKNGSGLSGTQTMEQLGVPRPSDAVQEALENADIAKFLHPDSAVQQLLQDLRDAYEHIDLLTGSSSRLAHQKLECLGIPASWFSNIIAGDRASKSTGNAYSVWLSLYEDTFVADQFLYVGDRPRSDYEVPRTFGIHSILVNMPEPKADVACLQLPAFTDLRKVLL